MRPRPTRRAVAAAAAVTAASALVALPASAAAPSASLRAQVENGTVSATHGHVAACAEFGCRASLVTTARGSTQPLTGTHPAGWGATALEQAFRVAHAPSGRRLVVIIGIGAYPTLESDLAVYRKQYGLPACTTASGCLTIRDYKGGPALQPSEPGAEEGLAVETSLDVQMVSAACPKCRIAYLGVPVQFGNKKDIEGFGIATRTAARLGAASVSMSYGFNTNSTTDNGALSRPMIQPGLQLYSASGDFGYMNPKTFQTGIGGWPQNLPSVVSVGGTTMTRDTGDPTGYAQTAWDAAGSGCAPDLGPAYGQPARIAAYCNGHRAVTDVSAVADNLAVYDTYTPSSGDGGGWLLVGGTSASSPFLAGLGARAARVGDALGPNFLYRAPGSAFVDIRTGVNGTPAQCSHDGVDQRLCAAATGWDGATGRGIPRGLAPFTS